MPKKNVDFTSQIKEANYEILIQGKRVTHATNKVKYSNKVDADTLEVEYVITGPNGTDYSITYSCKSDGQSKTDPTQASPVEGSIQNNGVSNEKLNIKLN